MPRQNATARPSDTPAYESDPIELLRMAATAMSMNQRDVNVNATGIPLSGFKTPFVNSGRWQDVKLGDRLDDDEDNRRSKGDGLFISESDIYNLFTKAYDTYPSWNSDNVPITKEAIESIFIQLTEVFGFQIDNTRNMFDYLMRLLDSRASRMGSYHALKSLHADYIGGVNSNFKKWYFAAQLDIDDAKDDNNNNNNKSNTNLQQAETQWCINMNSLSPADCIIQIGLYLLCWGESNNIRFMPECICFIFKCCNDYYYSLNTDVPVENITPSFLNHVINPLYNYYRDQCYQKIDDKYYHKDKDHQSIIGYDDMNQLFWYKQGLDKIILNDGKTKIMNIIPSERYLNLNKINWNKVFYKTYIETRSWSHVFTNFNRIWIIHISMFWYYTSYNSPTLYTKNYQQHLDNHPTVQITLSIMSLAGVIALSICIISTIIEFMIVPRKWSGAQHLFKRLLLLLIGWSISLLPTIYLFITYPLNVQTKLGLTISIIQFILSIIIVIYCSFIPLGKLFDNYPNNKGRRYLPTKLFTRSFYSLKGSDKVASYGLWFSIFISKFIESYFFLTLSLRDPVRELSAMKMTRCAGEIWIGNWLCSHQTIIVLGLIYLTDIVLFFLDTYLWYIVWNTIFSVCRSFYIGTSIWTPWRNIFSRLPKRIFSKIIAPPNDKSIKGKKLVSQVWNAIIISMYREHLLSLEHVQRLIYKQVANPNIEGGTILKEPTFFVSQEDQTMKSALFYDQSEAQRRITFFAQSLSTPMPEVNSIDSMPSFSVLIPHYSEKITLSLREIIKEEEQYSHVTMLEYLKSLHPLEWSCFVTDTKMLAEEFDSESSSPPLHKDISDDLTYYSVGYKIATPEYILRTRIWASLRSQTLYRTISGFMNYSRAIKLMFDIETPDFTFNDETNKLEAAAIMALRKFRIVVSMQRLKYFSSEEKENVELLLRAYPELQICYLDEEINENSDKKIYYSVLIDGTCAILEDGSRKPKYKIELSGNPILGDGKSDNQNHAVIFTRGEYIQLVDANQDNYLEECLKIRSVLAEFEEMHISSDPYSIDLKSTEQAHPVAIIGTREYIFSENIGILGDVAAGKEQTFGTLFARTLAHIGGKLHYGHPDFLNAIFMLTRGGVSKAQKGLHLNEDIYAGMNAVLRGGRIKHCEYVQCGKGRDLGFGSILNFTTKIGAGMGEQMLSREYFYLGTQLPLDRFLSFYYAHPGFHLNNVFIILSIQLFLFVGINLAALTNETTICEFDRFRPITDPRRPVGCYNLIPVVQWLERSIFSIFIVFLISFVPLGVQELTERGIYKAFTRLSKHFASFSPLFEVFVCRIYAKSLVSDIAIGGARYIGTGRGFATIRVSFSTLYSRFASESLYFGAICCLLILYCSISMWKLSLLYFWVTVIALLICPFLYNPNQYSWTEFFIDYKDYLSWLSRGNRKFNVSSWISFTRLGRSRIVGVKTKKFHITEDFKVLNDIRPSRFNLIISQSILQAGAISLIAFAYLFANAQNDTKGTLPVNSIKRILFITISPLLIDSIILIIFFIISLVIGPLISLIFKSFPSWIAIIVHSLVFINHIFFFELLWLFQNWDFSRTILGFTLSIMIQKWLLFIITATLISKEFRHDKSNKSWWSGKWVTAGLGWYIFTQPLREFICKISEMSYFVGDVVVGHLILFSQIPILLIPYSDKWHSLMLFWLKPGKQIRPRVLSRRLKRKRRFIANSYILIFILSILIGSSIFLLPYIITKIFDIDLEQYLPAELADLVQPYRIINTRKGLHRGLIKTY